MKSSGAIALALFGCVCSAALGEQRSESDALGLVIQMLADLRQKVQHDGNVEGNTYRKFKAWCDATEHDAHFAMDTSQRQAKKLEAEITRLESDLGEATTKIEDLVASISEDGRKLVTLKEVRKTEQANFVAAQQELMEMLQALEQAIPILSQKGSAALAQVDHANVAKALGTLLEAASFSTSGRSKLIALVQSKVKTSEDADDAADIAALGAPAGEAYSSKSGGILEILENMRDDGESQLTKLRTAETGALNSYALTKQSLQDSLAQDKKELESQKELKSSATEDKAEADGDYQIVSKDLKETTKEHETIQNTCVDSAADHEQTQRGRDEELNGLQQAMDALRNAGSSSFLQVATSATSTFSSRSPVVAAVKLLAKEQHSTSLAQLASRIASVMRHGDRSGQDPFHKVKELIKDMIYKIETKMNKEAEEKQYCRTQLKKIGLKEEDLNDEVADLRAKIEKDHAMLARLKEVINGLDGQLTDISKDQSELDSIRHEEADEHKKEKADLEKGLAGVRQALNTLKDLFGNEGSSSAMLQVGGTASVEPPAKPEAYERSTGAGQGIINMLEVIESEMSKEMVKLDEAEADAQADYDKLTAENKVVQAGKQKEEQFRETKEKGVKTELSEVEADARSTSSELDAVDQYLHQLKDRCQAKPDKHEERAAKRKQVIESLKHALTILKKEAASASFLQRRGSLRSAAVE